MNLPTSILRGYDKVTEKYVADALGIQVHRKHKKHRKHKTRHVKKGR